VFFLTFRACFEVNLCYSEDKLLLKLAIAKNPNLQVWVLRRNDTRDYKSGNTSAILSTSPKLSLT